MLTKEITYTDYSGIERKETFRFNMSQAELMEMQLTADGLYSVHLQKIADSKNLPELVKTVKDLILKAYGEMSDDGRRFIKSPEISEAFSQTEAYTQLFTELMNSETACTEFVMGILPAALRDAVNAQTKLDNAKSNANVAALPTAKTE